MLYRVFDTQQDVENANANWMQARSNAGIRDCKLGIPVTPEITQIWDLGRELIDGRIACQIPTMFTDQFGGIEEEVSKDMFVGYTEEFL